MVHKKTLVVDGITPVGAYAALRAARGEGSLLARERRARRALGPLLDSRLSSSSTDRAFVPRLGVDPFRRLAELVPTGLEDAGDVASRFATAHVGMVAYDVVHYATKVDPWPGARRAAGAPGRRSDGDRVRQPRAHGRHRVDRRRQRRARRGSAAERRRARAPHAARPDGAAERRGRQHERRAIRASGRAGQGVHPRRRHLPDRDGPHLFRRRSGHADPLDVYRALRVLSPAPYMYLLELPERAGAPEVAIAGASPETLVRVEGRRIILRPIAGTRRRGRNPEEDAALGQRDAGRPQGACRARHADRSGAQRRGPGGDGRHGDGARDHAGRALSAT